MPSRDPDDPTVGRGSRLTSLISRKLLPCGRQPFGVVPAGMGSGAYRGVSSGAHHTTTATTVNLVPPVVDAAFTETSGGANSGGAAHRKFVTLSTTTGSMHGELRDDVLDAYARERARELELEAEEKTLASKPLVSVDPQKYRTWAAEHANFSTVHHAEFHAGDAQPCSVRGVLNRYRAKVALERGTSVDMDSLRDQNQKQRAATSSQGYTPWTSGYSTTMRDHFAGYDFNAAQATTDRWATTPLQHRNRVLTTDDEAAVQAHRERFAKRSGGVLSTDVSAHKTLQLTTDECDRRHHRRSALGLSKDGIRTISTAAHRPREHHTGEDVKATGEMRSMSRHCLQAPDSVAPLMLRCLQRSS